MRSSSFHALPPNSTLTITVDPPVAINERPLIVAVRGPQPVVVPVSDSTQVKITNPSNTDTSYFAFCVTPRLNLERFPKLARILGGLL